DRDGQDVLVDRVTGDHAGTVEYQRHNAAIMALLETMPDDLHGRVDELVRHEEAAAYRYAALLGYGMGRIRPVFAPHGRVPAGLLQAAPAQDALGPEMRDRWYLDGGAALAASAPADADRWYLDAPTELAARALEPAPAARDRWYLD